MSFSSLLALAVGLSMDAAAVSASRGFAVERLRPRQFALVALFFGGSQALMPLLGWGLGARIGPWVASWEHWIAFTLLTGLGLKMLYEARTSQVDDDVPHARVEDPFGTRVMTLLAIATSVDAFAAGVTLPMIGAPLLLSLVTIGLTTATIAAFALALGHRFGARFGGKLDAAGGGVLVLLGCKLLFEHLRTR